MEDVGAADSASANCLMLPETYEIPYTVLLSLLPSRNDTAGVAVG